MVIPTFSGPTISGLPGSVCQRDELMTVEFISLNSHRYLKMFLDVLRFFKIFLDVFPVYTCETVRHVRLSRGTLASCRVWRKDPNRTTPLCDNENIKEVVIGFCMILYDMT